VTEPAPYLSADDLRSVPELSSVESFSDPLLDSYVTEYESLVERALGYACTPRPFTHTVPRECRTGFVLILPHLFVSEITEFTVDGDDFTDYAPPPFDDAVVRLRSRIYGDLSISGLHGLAEVPPGILRGCRTYVREAALYDSSALARSGRGAALQAAATDTPAAPLLYVTPNPPNGVWTRYPRVNDAINDQRLSSEIFVA